MQISCHLTTKINLPKCIVLLTNPQQLLPKRYQFLNWRKVRSETMILGIEYLEYFECLVKIKKSSASVWPLKRLASFQKT